MKKKTILGLKLVGPTTKTPSSIGWAIVQENSATPGPSSGQIKDISENEVITIARKKIGEYFKATREDKNLSYYAMAKDSGLTIGQIKDIEQGDKAYTIDSFLRMCRGLDSYFLLQDREGKHLDKEDMEEKMK